MRSGWQVCVIIMMSQNLFNFGSGNGMLPGSTKPLPEPIFTINPLEWDMDSTLI